MRDEVNVLLTEPVDALLQPVKEVLCQDWQTQAKWLQEIENALEKCGVNIKLTSESEKREEGRERSLFALLSWEEGGGSRGEAEGRMRVHLRFKEAVVPSRVENFFD